MAVILEFICFFWGSSSVLLSLTEEKQAYENIHSSLKYLIPRSSNSGFSCFLSPVACEARTLQKELICHFSRFPNVFRLLLWLNCFTSDNTEHQEREWIQEALPTPTARCHFLAMPDTLGTGVEERRWPRPRASEKAVGADGFEVSPSSFSPSAGEEVSRQHRLLPCHHQASQTCQLCICWWEHQGNHLQEGPLGKNSLLKFKRASSQDT